MMGRLEQDQGQLFYSFCLEEVVPDDHQVRAIASVLDLSWVYGELSPHYPALGRPSIDPVLMIRAPRLRNTGRYRGTDQEPLTHPQQRRTSSRRASGPGDFQDRGASPSVQ
jgi:hypothetical protein